MSRINSTEDAVNFLLLHKEFFLAPLNKQKEFLKWRDELSVDDQKKLNAINNQLQTVLDQRVGSFVLALESGKTTELKDLINGDEFFIQAINVIADKHVSVINIWEQELYPRSDWARQEEKKYEEMQISKYNELCDSCTALSREIAKKIHARLQDLYDPNSDILGLTPLPGHSHLEKMSEEEIERRISNGTFYSIQVDKDLNRPGWQDVKNLISRGIDLSNIMGALIPQQTSVRINLLNACKMAEADGYAGIPRIKHLAEHPNPIVNFFCKVIDDISRKIFGEGCFPELSKARNISEQLQLKNALKNVITNRDAMPEEEETHQNRLGGG